VLFAIMQVADRKETDSLPQHVVMQKWWAHMSDIMETNPDGSPVVFPLKEVFYLR
jgi:L-rhamnose mutarotase